MCFRISISFLNFSFICYIVLLNEFSYLFKFFFESIHYLLSSYLDSFWCLDIKTIGHSNPCLCILFEIPFASLSLKSLVMELLPFRGDLLPCFLLLWVYFCSSVQASYVLSVEELIMIRQTVLVPFWHIFSKYIVWFQWSNIQP